MQISLFNELSLNDLYKLLQLRARVFVQEQHSIYDEVDDQDQESWHFLEWQGDQLIAYARLIPPNTVFPKATIGRVVVHKSARKKGLGKKVFQAAFEHAKASYPDSSVQLSAQTNAKGLYVAFGFTQASKPYDDGGVEHIDMIWKKS